MKRAIVIASGKVQKVNYRDAVEEIARKLNITGFVENLKPYDVRIVAEGEDERIGIFIERIKINKFPIDVEGIEVRFEEFKGEFEYFEIKRGEWGEEIAERLDTAGKLLYKSVELGERSVGLGERSVGLGERSVGLGEESVKIGRTMLDKQDKTIAIIKSGNEMLAAKQDVMIEKQDKTLTIMKSGVEEMRESREENKTLLLDFHHDTMQRFDSLDVKYGMIAENIERILEELKEERKEYRESIEKLVNAIVESRKGGGGAKD